MRPARGALRASPGYWATLEQYAWVGKEFGAPADESRQSLLRAGMAATRTYEETLSKALLTRLQAIPEVTIYGQDNAEDVSQRVPTVAINLKGKHPEQVAKALAARDIYVWSGNYYALSVTERLGVEDSGGMVRIGAAQYNTLEEIEKLGAALEEIARE